MLDKIVCIYMLILLQIHVIWKLLNSCAIKMQLDGLLFTGVLPKVCKTSECYFVSRFKLKNYIGIFLIINHYTATSISVYVHGCNRKF